VEFQPNRCIFNSARNLVWNFDEILLTRAQGFCAETENGSWTTANCTSIAAAGPEF
jgi:hypothetical protein